MGIHRRIDSPTKISEVGMRVTVRARFGMVKKKRHSSLPNVLIMLYLHGFKTIKETAAAAATNETAEL